MPLDVSSQLPSLGHLQFDNMPQAVPYIPTRNSITAFQPWNCSRSRALARTGSLKSPPSSGDKQGGASGCVCALHARRSPWGYLTFQSPKKHRSVNQNMETQMDDDDVRNGTGPCHWYRKDTTASVIDIISRLIGTEANKPSVFCTAHPELTILQGMLSSSSSRTTGLLGFSAFLDDSKAC